MALNRYPRTARVRAGSDFDRIFKHGRRVALPVLALHWQSSTPVSATPITDAPAATSGDTGPRLGLAVSRKVDRRAVGRNRIKRIVRDAFRLQRSALQPGDYVVVARPGASRCSGDELRAAFASLLKRAGALRASAAPALSSPAAPASELPLSPAPGTMPSASPSTDPAPPHGAG